MHTHAPASHIPGAGKVAEVLADASSCLQGGVELRLPDAKTAAAYDLRPGSLNQAASDPDVARSMEECLTDWCRQVGDRVLGCG
jgi:hypothetical protein